MEFVALCISRGRTGASVLDSAVRKLDRTTTPRGGKLAMDLQLSSPSGQMTTASATARVGDQNLGLDLGLPAMCGIG
jgi:hypothetical protein